MQSLADWPEEIPSVPVPLQPRRALVPGELPSAVKAALWRGDQLGAAASPVIATGFGDLDRELPSGGWPCGVVTEVLQPQPTVAEWRLLFCSGVRIVMPGLQ